MKDMIFRDRRLWIGLLVVSILISSWGLTGCNGQNTSTTSPSPAEPSLTTSPEIPTATNEPLAALVNGMGIPLAFYEGEVARYKQAIESLGESLPSDAEVRTIVLNDLVDQTLLAQAAHEAGFDVSDELLAQRISDLAAEMGGEEALAIWQTEQGYDPAAFEAAMRLAIAATWQRDQIIASIPDAVEQVHAQQIFAYTSEGAQSALTSLNSGTDFNDLVWTYDPITGGELGWFPRGYLNVPAVEDAAFALAVGEHSQIIESDLGFHIVLVLEHDMEHKLTTDAKLAMQRQALKAWLQSQHDQGDIQIFIK